MSDTQDPTPDFVDRLEWQIRRELRRRDRFAAPRPPLWRRRGLRTAALVVLSALLGYAGATAAQEASERRRQELLELQSRSQLEIAELQLQFADQRLSELAPTMSQEELRRARFERSFLQRHVEAVELDLEELRLTGSPPRHDLIAPLVRGRDLVRARLELRLADLQAQRGQLAAEVERFERGVAAGSVEPFQVLYRRYALKEADRELTLTRRSLALRDQFLRGEIDEQSLWARREQLEARLEAAQAAGDAEVARARLQRIDATPADDPANELERLQASYQLKMAQARLELANTRLQLLRQRGGELE